MCFRQNVAVTMLIIDKMADKTTKSIIVNSFINCILLGKDIRTEWISIMVFVLTLQTLCTCVHISVCCVTEYAICGSDKCKSFHQLIESIVSC